jgi:HAD superfamily hydrolase (TIGR01509 family)
VSASADRRLAAVLWDLDGTLVDTEPYWWQAEHELVGEHGGQWSDEHGKAIIGNDLRVSAAYIRERGGVRLEIDEIVDRLLGAVIARVRERVPWRPGALELLAGLRAAGTPCALVTMSYRVMADTVVGALPAGSFQAVVTGDEVSRGKPHPEPYLTAARALGARPGDCLAIEDSPTGVASAEAAGVPVLAVQHLIPIPAAPGRRVLHSLVDVTPEALADLAATLLAA